jgi:hypothetical protein
MDDLKRDNHGRVSQMIYYFESHGISCHHNDQREDSPQLDLEYRDNLDNSRVYLIAVTKKCIDRIRGHGQHGMKDILAQEFQYILNRKGSGCMLPVIMDAVSMNTMRWLIPRHISDFIVPHAGGDL